MKLVSVAVTCKDQLETPEQKLDDGESITIRVVELAKLNQVLKGEYPPILFVGFRNLTQWLIAEYGSKVRAASSCRRT